MSKELEPLRACPFCGRPPTVQIHYIGANGKRVQISCEACDFRHPWNREDRAIKRWNKRKGEAEQV